MNAASRKHVINMQKKQHQRECRALRDACIYVHAIGAAVCAGHIMLLVSWAVIAASLAVPDVGAEAAPDSVSFQNKESNDAGVRFYPGENHYHGSYSHAHGSDKRSRIVDFALGPIYYEPTWILDYRFLKTGGRDYTRSDGGGIIILPKGIRSKEPNEFRDYDSLIDHLRLQLMSEEAAERRHYLDDHDNRRHNRKQKTDKWWRDNSHEGSL